MSYTLDNAHDASEVRMRVLEALYDRPCLDQFDAIRVRPGWRCWEIGAGGGSLAVNLANRGAHVTTTDLDLSRLSQEALTKTTCLVHNVVRDDPPALDWDLIHLRLVASHLRDWKLVLPRLVHALRPGGWLLVEELDPMTDYQPAPNGPVDALVNNIGRTFTAVLSTSGGLPQLGRRLRRQLDGVGLVETASHGLVVEARGGEPASQLMVANVQQTAPMISRFGITPAQLDGYLRAMKDPDTYFVMPTFWLARGRRALK